MAVPPVLDWLTTDFFQSCLQSHKKQQLTVTNHTIQPAVVPDGNNYGSQLLRVKVDYDEEDTKSSISLIVKAPVANIEAIFSEVYEKEAKYYSEFICGTYKYCEHDLVPKHYVSPNPHCVVLEDLNTSGYVMVDRHNLLDLEHCQLHIKAKAQLNALSVVVYRENPNMTESLVQTSSEQLMQLQHIMKISMEMELRCMAAYLEDKPDLKEYLDIIEEAIKDDKMWKLFQEIESSNAKKPLRALIQMDPWCTNMMFKYDSLGKVKNVKLLDFQNIYFTSPLVELVTFLSVSPNLDVRKTKLNSLYQLFCDEFNTNMEMLKCPERINSEEMKAEIITMRPLVLMNTCGLLPLVLVEGAADMGALMMSNLADVPIKETPFYKLYQEESFNRVYPQVLN